MKLKTIRRRIETPGGSMKVIILRPKKQEKPVPGILWIHGGGYVTGVAAMVFVTAGSALAKHYGAVLIAPEYRRAVKHPYPAALEDCYAALEYLYNNADELGVDRDRIVVGGESAGGGLAAAICIYARTPPATATPTAGEPAGTTGAGILTCGTCTARTTCRPTLRPHGRRTTRDFRPAIPLWKTGNPSGMKRSPT